MERYGPLIGGMVVLCGGLIVIGAALLAAH